MSMGWFHIPTASLYEGGDSSLLSAGPMLIEYGGATSEDPLVSSTVFGSIKSYT